MSHIDYANYVVKRFQSAPQKKYSLFLRLKELEVNVNLSTLPFFELADIGKVLQEFDLENTFEPRRLLWKGPCSSNSFRAILNLSIISPKLLLALSRISTSENFLNYCKENQRKCLIVTDWGFPFGGAEAFFEETASILDQLGFNVEWVNFQIPGRGQHLENRTICKSSYKEFQVKNFPSDFILRGIINSQRPDLILSHGHLSQYIEKISEDNGIPSIIGFHFWTGLIELEKNCNVDILENIDKHHIIRQKTSNPPPGSLKYLVSDFMYKVYKELGGTEEFEVIVPKMSFDISPKFQGPSSGSVTILDVSIGKGGLIFCEIVEQLGHEIPFYAVIRDSTEKQVKDRLLSLSGQFPLLKLVEYGDVMEILQKTRILIVPSQVDETYSRVPVEAITQGIPALTSIKGNLRFILGGVGAIDSTDANVWISKIASLYWNTTALSSLWSEQSIELRALGKQSDILDLILKSIPSLSVNRVGIFTANGSQGLGTLGKILFRQIESINMEAFIFAFKPYFDTLEEDEYWSDLESNIRGRISISKYTREEVPTAEVLKFVDESKIDVLIFPEVCWEVNWKRLESIQQLRPNLRIITIPMLETVINYEVPLLNNYDLTLFPTRQSLSKLESLGVRNGQYLGFTSPVEDITNLSEISNESNNSPGIIKFLHVAGHSPSVRKNTSQVIKEFIEALEYRKDISLTVTLQIKSFEIASFNLPPEITIIAKKLSDKEVINLYRSHDVSIQIPTHEGIGIGFYESISQGTPVATIDSEPHCEVIAPKLSGWLLPSYPIPLVDNPLGVVKGANLKEGFLTKFIVDLSFEEVLDISAETEKFYLENFSNSNFANRLITILGSKNLLYRKQLVMRSSESNQKYEELFNLIVRFGKRSIYTTIPFSLSQKYRIKRFILKLDGVIRKLT